MTLNDPNPDFKVMPLLMTLNISETVPEIET